MDANRLTSLVRGVQAGNEAALTALYNEYYNEIYYYILKTLGSTKDPELAEDLTQDTFIEIIQTIDKLQDPGAFAAWSRKIAYHRCTAYFRKRRDLLADEQEDGSTVFDSLVEEQEDFIPGESLDKEDFRNTIQHMIDSLPEEQRSAVMMRYFDELSVQQIAEIQSTTEGTVKSRLNYARKAIKKAVEDYEKKHDIRLHCAGVVPMLLWLFRMRKRELLSMLQAPAAAATPAAAAVSPAKSTATKLVKHSVSASAKAVKKVAAGKIIAAVTAVAVTAGAVGIGIAQLTKKDQPRKDNEDYETEEQEDRRDDEDRGSDRHETGILSSVTGSESQYTEQTEVSDAVSGTWVCEDGTLTAFYSEAAEGYFFQYQPVEGNALEFIGDCAPGESVYFFRVWVTQASGVAGNVTYNWGSDVPNFMLQCSGDTLLWALGEDATLVLTREGASAAPVDRTVYQLEDYPEYVAKVAEYRSAIFADSFDSDNYPTLNYYMLQYYHMYGDGMYFFYALEDIDSNGTPELFIGRHFSAPDDGAEPIDVYSISGGNLVQYFANPNYGEKSWLSPLSGGLLMDGGSYSAASGGCSVFAISEDGSHVTLVANYTYYFPDQHIEPPAGDYMNYEDYKTATAAYEPYEYELLWNVIEP